jgi:hypothetical protein
MSMTFYVSEPWDYHNWEPVLRHLQDAQVHVVPFWTRAERGEGAAGVRRTLGWLQARGIKAAHGELILEPHLLATLPIIKPRPVSARYCRLVRMQYAVISKQYTYSAKNAEYDCVLVASRFGRDLLARHGVRTEVVGYPKLDDVFNGVLTRARARTQLGIPPDRTVVLYAPTFGSDCAVERVAAAFAGLSGSIDLLLQLHPVSYVAERERFTTLPLRFRWIDEADASIATVVAADAVVTDYSGVAFEACAIDRPVVLLDNPDLDATEDVERLYRDFAPRVVQPQELCAAVEGALAHPERFAQQRAHYRERFFEHHGQAGRRAAEALRGLEAEAKVARGRDVDVFYNRLRALETHLQFAGMR